MSLDLGTAFASIEVRTGNLERDVQNVERRLDALSRNAKRNAAEMGRAFSEVGTRLSIGLTAPILAMGAASFKASLDMDTLKRSLRAVTSDAEQFNREMREAKEIAKLPGLGFSESIAGLVKLQSGGIKEALSVETLKQFGNALATVGKGRFELAAVNEQISQMVGKGRVLQEDIRIISQYVPQLRQAMKAAFGTSDTEAIQKMGMSVDEFLTKLNIQLAALPRMSSGIKNSLENASDAAKVSMAAIGDSITAVADKILSSLTPAIEIGGKSFQKLPQEAKDAILGGAGLVAIMGVATLALGKFLETWAIIKTSAATPILFKVGVVVAGIGLLKELIDYRERMIADENRRKNEGINRLFPSDFSNVKGFRQFDVKKGYSDSARKTLEAINREQRSLSISSGFPGSRRDQLTKDAVAIIRDQEKMLADRAKQAAQENPISLTRSGRQVQLQQGLTAVRAQKEALLNKIATAKTNAQRNLLGDQMGELSSRETRLEKALELFDPKKMSEIAKRQQEALDQYKADLDSLTDKYKGMRTKAFQKFQKDSLEIGQPKASALYRAQLHSIEKEEKKENDRLKETQKKKTMEQQLRISDATWDVFKGNLAREKALQQEAADIREQMMSAVSKNSLEKYTQRLRDERNERIRILEAELTEMANMRDNMTIPGRGKDVDMSKRMPAVPFDNPLARPETPNEYKDRIARVENQLRRSLGGHLGTEIAYGFVDSFAQGLEKAFGNSSIGRIFARGLSRWLDKEVGNMMDNLFSSLAKGKKGGIGGIAGPSGIGGLLGSFAPILGIGAAIGGLFKGLKFADGGWVPGPIGAPQPAVVHGGEFVMSRKMLESGGGGGSINIANVNVASDYDVDRFFDRLAWHTKGRQANNPGTF